MDVLFNNMNMIPNNINIRYLFPPPHIRNILTNNLFHHNIIKSYIARLIFILYNLHDFNINTYRTLANCFNIHPMFSNSPILYNNITNRDIIINDLDIFIYHVKNNIILCNIDHISNNKSIMIPVEMYNILRDINNNISKILHLDSNILIYYLDQIFFKNNNHYYDINIYTEYINILTNNLHFLNGKDAILPPPYIKLKYKQIGSCTNCIICLGDYDMDEEIIALQCLHKFHEECIIKWLEKDAKCPICQLKISL